MCLVTDQFEPKTATENIVVFKSVKILNPNCVQSCIMNQRYELGKLYKTTICRTNDYTTCDSLALHELIKKYPEFSNNFSPKHVLKQLVSYGQGYHSFVGRRCENIVGLVKCTIPVGSTYYTDVADELYVSDKIIVDEILLQSYGKNFLSFNL